MHKKIVALIFAVLIAGLCTASCMTPDGGQPAEVSPPGPPLKIMCSMPPLYFFTANVATLRKNIVIETLHPKLSDDGAALVYTPADIQQAAGAAILVTNGLGLDSTLGEEVKKLNPGIKIIDSSGGITADKGPYLWMSPRSGLRQAQNIATALIELDPAGKKEIDRKSGEYKTALEKIIKGYEELGKAAKDKKVLAARDFLAYVGRDFGGPLVISATPEQIKDAAQLPALLSEQGALAFFSPMAGMEKTGEGQRQYLSLCLKDSLYPDSYEKTMKANLEILKKALQ